MVAYAPRKPVAQRKIMPWKIEEIANQNFAPGDDFLKSIANQARKVYCEYSALDEAIPDVVQLLPPPLMAMQKEFIRSVCELPQDPVPLPSRPRIPSNSGGCDCQLYRVTAQFTAYPDAEFPPFTSEPMYGPVGIWAGPIPGGTTAAWGFVNRGDSSTGCLPSARRVISSQGFDPRSQLSILGIAPAGLPGSPFINCARPTLPTAPPSVRVQPPALPTINIPVPGLPPIVIPVIAAPIFIKPEFNFSPQFVLDVGGINVEFKLGEVNLSYSPTFAAPITINPPGFSQPQLPPTVQPQPLPDTGDCCVELLAGQQDIKEKLTEIEACVCPKEQTVVEQVSGVQAHTFQSTGRVVRTANLVVDGYLDRKAFGVPGGQEVRISGWYSFMVENRKISRESIQYDRNELFCDIDGVDGFTFSLYNGLTATCTIFADIEEETQNGNTT